nr:MAG TPA: hypothetical protein [Caudoviricetes sp.]
MRLLLCRPAGGDVIGQAAQVQDRRGVAGRH